MPAVAARRLPGVTFEPVPPPPREVLPRMDVAGFVGFASSGPIDVPVAVEDAAQFAAVFGDDLRLAWDPRSGSWTRAHLGPSVRAFFRNGGRRAWVVRVAGGAARRAELPVPGLLALNAAGAAPVRVTARSVGGALGGVRAGAALSSTPLHILDAAPGRLTLELEPRVRLAAGDVIRVSAARNEVVFAAGSVEELTREPGGSGVRPRVRVTAEPRAAVRLERMAIAVGAICKAVLAPGAEPPSAPVTATVVASPPSPSLPPPPATGPVALEVAAPFDRAPEPGTLVRVDELAHERTLWVLVESVGQPERGGVSAGQAFVLRGRPFWVVPVDGPLAMPAGTRAERLELGLVARAPDGTLSTLTDLALGPRHPRYLGALPVDEQLYAAATGGAPVPPLWSEAATPRFPLAGAPAAGTRLIVPLGVEAVPRYFLGAQPATEPALALEGLEELTDRLFLDRDLRGARLGSLAGLADALAYTAEVPRRLRGIHALMHLDEVTLVAAPDAARGAWARVERAAPPPPPASEPVVRPGREGFDKCSRSVPSAPLLTVSAPDSRGSFLLTWTASDAPDARYVLQETRDQHSFDGAVTILEGPHLSLRLYGREEGTWYYRVRAEAGGELSEWSGGVAVAVGGPVRYVVSDDGSESDTLLAVQRALVRMAAARGDVLCVLSLPERAREDDALSHVARLTSGQAPGAAPAGLDPVPALDGSETGALSYAAAYHPWLTAPDPGSAGMRLPPDGPAAGILAARAALHGAWIAPANLPLVDVVDADPAMGEGRLLALRAAQLNVVRNEPGGFLCLSADTLSPDPDLRPIGVRRLMSLLRRAALLHGPAYVFEPNSPPVRRAIERAFSALLSTMFERGAFAGAAAEQAFQVVVDASPADVDGGRLVVALKVAPARPLEFLTVRLVDSGSGLRVEGA